MQSPASATSHYSTTDRQHPDRDNVPAQCPQRAQRTQCAQHTQRAQRSNTSYAVLQSQYGCQEIARQEYSKLTCGTKGLSVSMNTRRYRLEWERANNASFEIDPIECLWHTRLTAPVSWLGGSFGSSTISPKAVDKSCRRNPSSSMAVPSYSKQMPMRG
jgi:hypothetical protein